MIDRFGWSSSNFGDFFFWCRKKIKRCVPPYRSIRFSKEIHLFECSGQTVGCLFYSSAIYIPVCCCCCCFRCCCSMKIESDMHWVQFSSVSPMAIYYKRFLHRILFIHTTRHNSCWSLLLYENRPMYATAKSLKSIENKKKPYQNYHLSK